MESGTPLSDTPGTRVPSFQQLIPTWIREKGPTGPGSDSPELGGLLRDPP